MMRPVGLKVGELAKRTGISVRTLHHYDQIGLLSPSNRTEAGYRLYSDGEIIRLQQIMSLRQLGLFLEDIRHCLVRSDFSLQRVIELHLARLREQMESKRKLYDRLEAVAAGLRSTERASVENLLQIMEEMTKMEKYYTPEQLEELAQRRETLGEERIRQAEADWANLMKQVRAEMEKGTDPTNDRVQSLARRWMALVQEFSGGNPEIEKSLRNMYHQESTVHGMDTASMREMMDYISKALAASKG